MWTSLVAGQMHSKMANLRLRITGYAQHACAWLLPATAVALLVVMGGVGDAGNNCWIRGDFQWARLSFYYAPLLLSWMYTIYVYSQLSKRLVSISPQEHMDLYTRS